MLTCVSARGTNRADEVACCMVLLKICRHLTIRTDLTKAEEDCVDTRRNKRLVSKCICLDPEKNMS